MDQASSCLMHILRTDFDLLDHFRTVQLFLLMEAGDTMHHFASDIFTRVSLSQPFHHLSLSLSIISLHLLPPVYPRSSGVSRGGTYSTSTRYSRRYSYPTTPTSNTGMFTPAEHRVDLKFLHFSKKTDQEIGVCVVKVIPQLSKFFIWRSF